jgi:hypothetical protein
MRAALLALLVAALLALAPGAAHAEDPPPQVALRLTYVLGPGAKNCPPEQALHDEVARRMGYDPFTAEALEHVVATLNREGHLFSGTLELFDSSGKSKWRNSYAFRSNKDEDCATLDVAMAIDLSLDFIHFSLPSPAEAPSPPPLPEAPRPAEAPVAPPEPPAPARSAPPIEQASRSKPPVSPSATRPPPSDGMRIEVGGGSFVALGIAPGVALGGALQVGLYFPSIPLPLSIAVEGHVDGSFPGAVDPPRQARITTLQFGGAAVACWRPPFFQVCGVATASEVYLQRTEPEIPKAGGNPAFRAGARVGTEISLRDPFGLRLHAEILGTLMPARANVEREPAWSTSPVSGGAGLTIVRVF